MKFTLTIFFIAIFSIITMGQQKIGVPFVLKTNETANVGKLKIKYLGSLAERAYGWGSKGERMEISYARYNFEVENNGEKEEFKEVFNFKTGNLVVEIIGKIEDSNLDAVRIVVKTAEQFEKDKQQKAESSNDVEQLSKVKTFALGPTGYAGIISQGEKLMSKILAGGNAKIYFEQILKDGTDEAKLYALYALQKIDKKESGKYFEPYRQVSTEVQRMSGCEIFREKFSNVIAEIEKMP